MDGKLHDEFGRIMDAQGAFVALKQMKAKIGAEHDALYKLAGDHILRMTAEARSEMKKLDAVLARIEMAARQVQTGRRADELLTRELAPLGGWVVSLLETYVSYTRFMKGDLADQKINEVASALHDLRAKQDASNQRFGKFAEVWQAFARH